MDAFVQKVAKRGMDQALPRDARLAGEGRGLDRQCEMAFPAAVMAGEVIVG